MEGKASKPNRLTLYIGIALVIGIVTGFIFNKQYVGAENNKIFNADIQIHHLHLQMKPFEKIKDSLVYNKLVAQQKELIDQKKTAEQNLLNSEDESQSLSSIKFINRF